MSGISLSQGVRSDLKALQETAAELSVTQGRLATGKKVNSALDNPSVFFTSQSLSNRAAGLNALFDSIGQAQHTLDEASKGLGSIAALVQSAKSIAQRARDTPPPVTDYAAVSQSGSADVSAETTGSVTGSVDTSGGFTAVVDGLQI